MSSEDHAIKLTADVGYIKGRVDGILDNVSEMKDGQQSMLQAFSEHLRASNDTHTEILRRQDRMELKVGALAAGGVLILREGVEWFIRHFHI